jgi:hypothetical protein
MADSCQETNSFLPNWFTAVSIVLKSKVLSEAEPSAAIDHSDIRGLDTA